MSETIVKCVCQHCQRVTVVPQETVRQLLSEAEKREREARAKAVEDVLSALTAHELYQYRPKAFQGFIEYARSALQSEER